MSEKTQRVDEFVSVFKTTGADATRNQVKNLVVAFTGLKRQTETYKGKRGGLSAPAIEDIKALDKVVGKMITKLKRLAKNDMDTVAKRKKGIREVNHLLRMQNAIINSLDEYIGKGNTNKYIQALKNSLKQSRAELKKQAKAAEKATAAEKKLALEKQKVALANQRAMMMARQYGIESLQVRANIQRLMPVNRQLAMEMRKVAIASTVAKHSMDMLSKVRLKNLYQGFIQLRSIITSLMVFVGMFVGMAYTLKKFAGAANEVRSAMTGLKTVAKATGRDWTQFNAVIEQSLQHGVSRAEASATLRNLMLIENATTKEVITTYWNLIAAAKANTKEHYPLGQQIQKTSEGLRDLRSQASDAIGVGKNLDLMIKEFAQSVGKTTEQLSFQEKQHAALLGFMHETKKFLPLLSAEELENVRATEAFSASWRDFMAMVGEFVMPLVTALMNHINGLLLAVRNWMKEHKKSISEVLQPFTEIGKRAISIIFGIVAAVVKLIPSVVSVGITFVKLYVVLTMMAGLALLVSEAFKIIRAESILTAVVTGLASGNIAKGIMGIAAASVAAYGAVKIGGMAKEMQTQFGAIQKDIKATTLDLEELKKSTEEMSGRSGAVSTKKQSLNVHHTFDTKVSVDKIGMDKAVDEYRDRIARVARDTASKIRRIRTEDRAVAKFA